ncbi:MULTISPECIES: class I SAM-dependent methyltransferase [Calothrix]|uniref:Class I SAM-dependent methyltransferase n=2 Tax=Calothrix TaxID=1186 RepID=A0ABR8ANV5_9CYAN|nr:MULTISPECIES: class I SAM-dependent methyltransferase [Calothrix]MBD2200875.1 class I SAM-dependent methyltransferase [Calothrix parietina FACHB-288]MBD2229537.1 class I SAM-dependent methyltransferase [Calothrix anomala FACHB-343]
MAIPQNLFWERFLSPVVKFLIDEAGLERYALSIDWDKQSARFQRADVLIPTYYSNHKFRSIEGGYLNPKVVVSYDPIMQYLLPPNEYLVRQALIDAIQVKPRRILDLGCGTGSTTLMLKQAFPQAEVIGLDLSAYMLVLADNKATNAGLDIIWRHGNAQKTAFGDAAFDLVTASLLFREIPTTVCQAIVQECFRVLVAGGQVLLLDVNQKALRQLEWLNDAIEEPYLREYAAFNLDKSMEQAGFATLPTQDVWWIHQITSGVKPLAKKDVAIHKQVRQYVSKSTDNGDLEDLGSPVFGIRT